MKECRPVHPRWQDLIDSLAPNVSGPDRSIRMEDLQAGRAVRRRYHRIGEFLKELDLTEGRSTVIPKVLLATLNLSHRPTLIQNYLQPALEAEWVEMTQPQSPRSPTQKYRLTNKGKAWLKGRRV